MQKNLHNFFLVAIILNTILFAAVLLAFNCCISTDTDIYFLYTLAGGFGDKPSILLHYLDAAHPLLTSIVAFFFNYFPLFNWYSFFLLLFHFASCTVLLYSLLSYLTYRWQAIVTFLVFFLFFECRSLLRLDFSGAALMGVVGGSISLLLHLKRTDARLSKRVAIFCLFIFVGGLIRIHYMILFACFAVVIGFSFLNRKQLFQLIAIELLLGLLLGLFFQGQRYYFQKRIPNWSSEERLRKAHIYYVNHPHNGDLSPQAGAEKIKQELISSYLTYDTSFTGFVATEKFGHDNIRQISISKNTPIALYWLFMDVRVYLLLFMSIAILLINNMQLLWIYLYRSLFFVVVFLLLGTFFKTTEIILLSVLVAIFFSGAIILPELSTQRRLGWVGIALLLLSCIWMTIRLIKMSSENTNKIAMARNIVAEMNVHPTSLFVAVGPPFTFNLSIWDTPNRYPLHNFIYDELFYSNSYHSQLDRFGIRNLMKEIPVNNNVFLVGQRPEALIGYYQLVYMQTVDIKKMSSFKFFNAYRITPKN